MATKWNSSIMFPTDSCFVNRITDLKFGSSQNSGNVMVTMELEVHSPQEYEIGGQMINIAGVQCKQYYTTTVFKKGEPGVIDEEKTRKSRQRLVMLLNSLGIETGVATEPDMNAEDVDLTPCALNWDNLLPQIQSLKGKLVLTEMSPDEEEKTKTPTAKQIEEGRKAGLKLKDIKGDQMRHPVTGKALFNYWPKVRQIFGAAPEGQNAY